MDNGELRTDKVSERLLAAKHYAELGYGVLYIPLNTKSPNTRHWGRGTMIDPNVIQAVYDMTNGDGNIGLKLGNDTRAGTRLSTWNATACKHNKTISMCSAIGRPSPIVYGQRGRHYLYQWRDGLPPKTAYHLHNDKERLEVRIGNNGVAQSVLPPSLHPDGMTYQWVEGLSPDEVPLAALPDDAAAKLWEAYLPEKGAVKVYDGELPYVDCPVKSRDSLKPRLILTACRQPKRVTERHDLAL